MMRNTITVAERTEPLMASPRAVAPAQPEPQSVSDPSETDVQLVAYVVCRPGRTMSAAELRTFLEGRLPEFMVPRQFVFLDALPLNHNGKVDRQALPEPELAAPRQAAFVAPRSGIESRLADIWSDVLRIDAVGAHDNFFRLGGHSLLALQVMARVREAFQVDLPLRVLFESPTPAAFAEILAHAPKNEGAAPIPRIARNNAGSSQAKSNIS